MDQKLPGDKKDYLLPLLSITTALGALIIIVTTTSSPTPRVAGTWTINNLFNLLGYESTNTLDQYQYYEQQYYTQPTPSSYETTPPPSSSTTSSSTAETTTTTPTTSTSTATTTTTPPPSYSTYTAPTPSTNTSTSTPPSSYQDTTSSNKTSPTNTPTQGTTFLPQVPTNLTVEQQKRYKEERKVTQQAIESYKRQISQQQGGVFWIHPTQTTELGKTQIIGQDSTGNNVVQKSAEALPPTTTQSYEQIPQQPSQQTQIIAQIKSEAYLPKPELEEIANPTIAPLFANPDQTPVVSKQLEGAPKLTSTSHKNDFAWSRDNNPKFNWEAIPDAKTYKISMSPTPEAPKEELGKQTNISFENLPEGSWYLSVSAVKEDGTQTPPAVQRVLIDRTPPKIASVKILDSKPTYQNGSTINVKVKWNDNLFNTPFTATNKPDVLPSAFLTKNQKSLINQHRSDILAFTRFVNIDFSKIDSNFDLANIMAQAPIKIGSNQFETTISYRISKDNTFTNLTNIELPVSVQDFAGNSQESKIGAELANDSPIKLANLPDTYFIQEEVKDQGIPLLGKALANSLVTLSVFSNPILATVRADENGNWTYTLRQELEEGNHTIYAKSQDSSTTTPETQIGSFNIIPQAKAAEVEGLITELSKIPAPSEEVITSPPGIKQLQDLGLLGKSKLATAAFAAAAMLVTIAFSIAIFHFRRGRT